MTSRGPVASVAIYTRREPRDIRTIAMDTSSRTSVALATVILRRRFDVAPGAGADGAGSRTRCSPQADAALIIGDVALFLDHEAAGAREDRSRRGVDGDDRAAVRLRLLDRLAGRGRRRTDVMALQRARDAGVAQSDAVAAAYYPEDTARQAVARRYLRDNIQYVLGGDEIDGLTTFYPLRRASSTSCPSTERCGFTMPNIQPAR